MELRKKSKTAYELDMCSGPLFSKLVVFAVPLMLSGILQLLFNAADIAVVDINEEWTVDPENLHSKSHNTCFKGRTFKGKVKYTILDGNIVFEDN